LIVKAQVVSAAREWIGVPFRHQGRTRDGIDCAGVVIKVAHALGLSSFDATGYRRLPAGIGQEKIEDVCRREMIAIEEAKAGPGDVVLYYMGNRPRHLAVLADYHAGGLSIVHAYEPAGRVTENRPDPRWRVFEMYALPGVR
jgi:cell wall-associated NlpC family hydrolase